MRLVFLGTSEFALPSLEALCDSRHEVALVVTQPDRPSGRGRRPTPPPVKRLALERELDLLQPASVNTRAARASVDAARPEVCVVVSFGQILRPKFLALAPEGCLNVHASVLPRHRGASPIQAAILAGDAETGVSIMRLDEGLDTGPVLRSETVTIGPATTAGELHDELAVLGARLIVDVLDGLAAGGLLASPQDERLATHAPLIRKEEGRLDFGRPAEELARRVRAFDPWPGSRARLVTAAGELDVVIEEAASRTASADAPPGTIASVDDDELRVACASGELAILRLKPAGRRGMSVRDFRNGHRVAAGDRFET